jgi:TRAP-type C4-dicarboxylate transport system permease small subunit
MKWIDRAGDFLKILGGICLCGMMLVTCVDVVGRFFLHPIFGSVEVVSLLAVLAVAMALPYTHRMRGHIGVEIIIRRLQPRLRALVELHTHVLSLLLFALVCWRMTLYAMAMHRSGELTANLRLPEYVVIYVVAFSFGVFVLSILKDIVSLIGQIRRR